MATMVSGSPLARRRAVRKSGRSKRANSGDALQAIDGDGTGAADGETAACFVVSDGSGRGAGTATAGIAAGVAAGAATWVNSGATKSAGADTWACALVCSARTVCTAKRNAVAAGARAMQAMSFCLL